MLQYHASLTHLPAMPAIWRGRRGRAPEIGGLAEVKIFASDVAKTMEQAEPKRFTATLSKKARNGRIFVDYLRNAAAPLLSLPDF